MPYGTCYSHTELLYLPYDMVIYLCVGANGSITYTCTRINDYGSNNPTCARGRGGVLMLI